MAETKNRIFTQGAPVLFHDTFCADRWEDSPRHTSRWGDSFKKSENSSDDSVILSWPEAGLEGFIAQARAAVGKYSKMAAHVRRGRHGLAREMVVITRAQYDSLLSRLSALEIAVQPPAVAARDSLSQTSLDALCETAKQLFGNAELHEEVDDEGVQRPTVRVSVADNVEPAEASKLASAWYEKLVEIEPDAKPGLIGLSIQFL
jgi:hypothetical protein